jgi:hypothetical protein
MEFARPLSNAVILLFVLPIAEFAVLQERWFPLPVALALYALLVPVALDSNRHRAPLVPPTPSTLEVTTLASLALPITSALQDPANA